MVKKWQKLAYREFKGAFKTYATETYKLPNGTVADFDISLGKNFVVVLALDTQDKGIFVRQYRPGTERIYEELPMGLIEHGETIKQAAGRELLEETGYEAARLRIVAKDLPVSPYSRMTGAAVIAYDCQKITNQSIDATEDIEVFTQSLEGFVEHTLLGAKTQHAGVVWVCLYALVKEGYTSWERLGL